MEHMQYVMQRCSDGHSELTYGVSVMRSFGQRLDSEHHGGAQRLPNNYARHTCRLRYREPDSEHMQFSAGIEYPALNDRTACD